MGDGRIFDLGAIRPSVSLLSRLVAVVSLLGSADRRPCRAGIRRGRGTEALAQEAKPARPGGGDVRARTWNADTVRNLRLANGDLAPPAPTRSHCCGRARAAVSLSVSGAVSLGSYQGGFLYYLLAALKAERKLGRARRAVAAGDGCRPSRARLSA